MVEKRESLAIWETFLKVHSNVSLISSYIIIIVIIIIYQSKGKWWKSGKV